MNKYLFGILFIFTSLTANGQLDWPSRHYSFDNVLDDSSGNGANLTAYGGATFDASIKHVGSHSGQVHGSDDYFLIPTSDLGSTYCVSLWLRSDGTISDQRMFFCVDNSSDYFYISGLATNKISVRATGGAAAGDASITATTWHHYVVGFDKASGKCRIWHNGAREQSDSTMGISSWNTNDEIRIGTDYYGGSDWDGNFDELLIYKFMPSEAQVDSLYDLSYRPLYEEESPPGGGGVGTPVFRLPFNNSCADQSGHNFSGTCTGGSIFSSTYMVEGSHSWVGADDANWESTGNYTFPKRKFTIAASVRRYVLYGAQHCLFTNKQSDGSQGIDIQWDETNQRIYGRSYNGSSSDDFYTEDDILDYDTWYHWVIVVDSNHVRIWQNGVKLTLSDSTILTDWFTGPDTIAIGSFTGAVSSRDWEGGYIDDFHFYNYAANSLQADSLWDYRTSSTFQLGEAGGGPAYNPPQLRVFRDGIEKIPYKDGLMKYFKKGVKVEPPPGGDTITYYFAENFETLPNLSYSTILQYWKPWISFWYASSQSIANIGGDHGKVWRSIYHQNMEAQADGMEIFIPLNDTVNEIWMERHLKADLGFNGYSTTCHYSGKIMGGVYGGRNPLYNGPYYGEEGRLEWLDSTLYGNGWSADGEWGSAPGGCYGGNANAMWVYWGDQTGFYKDLHADDLYIPRDDWMVLTTRVKLNHKGKADGILELYVDGQLAAQVTNAIFRSVEQYNGGANEFDGLMMRFMFGGGAGPNYICPRNDTMMYDNLVVYKYNPAADNYLSGPAPSGHTIPIVAQAGGGLANIYPETTFSNESFTAPSGTIQSHYSGVFFVPQSKQVWTKTITGHSNPIRLSFTYYHNGWNQPSGSDDESYIIIYSGTGSGKTELWHFVESGEENGEPTIGATYIINSTAATIEYWPGRDWNGGWKINYW